MHSVLPLLEECLVEKKREEQKQKSKPWIAYSLVFVALIWLSFSGYQSWLFDQKIKRGLSYIQSQPGVALLDYRQNDELLTFNLLQDPSSGNLKPQLSAIFGDEHDIYINSTYANLDQKEVWLNYLNNHYRFTSKPILDLNSGVLYVQGKILQDELEKLKKDSLVKNKFTSVDLSNAEIISPLTKEEIKNIEISKLKNRINAVQLFFETSQTQLSQSEQSKLRVLAEDLLELQAMASGELAILGQILILGFADSAGTNQKNLNLSRERAQYVADYFVAQGIDSSLLVIHPMGHVDVKNLDSQQQRRVTVSVISSRADSISPDKASNNNSFGEEEL